MTTIHMFKNHPNKDKIHFVVLPIAAEIMRAPSDSPMSIYDLREKYKNGNPNLHGLILDWSLIFSGFGNPELWRINILTDLARQKMVYDKLQMQENGRTNYLQVLYDIFARQRHELKEDFENPEMVYHRA